MTSKTAETSPSLSHSGQPSLPTMFIPHGGGPCFFMDWTMGPADTWFSLRDWLSRIPATLPQEPKAILIISGHWETQGFRVTGHEHPSLIYDYSGFPEHTYHLQYPAPGSPELAGRIRDLIASAGLPVDIDPNRGFDHGTFIPLMVAFPKAEIPVVQLSLDRSLDPALHLQMGKAIATLRDEGVLIIGSGMSYHNLQGFFSGRGTDASQKFDTWLTQAVCAVSPEERSRALSAWQKAPGARESHPREEHLIPLMVAVGAAGNDRGIKAFEDQIMRHPISAFTFG